jgi:hypothetical protein
MISNQRLKLCGYVLYTYETNKMEATSILRLLQLEQHGKINRSHPKVIQV